MRFIAILAGLTLVVGCSCQRSDLSPDKDAVHYRYGATPRSTSVSSSIADLEERVRKLPSPIDLTELADLYVQRGQETGDREAFVKAEALARQSLEILRSPNGATLILAKLKNLRHEFAASIALCNEILAEKPSAAAQKLLVSSYLALGELAKAAEIAEAVVATHPDTSAYLTRALVMQAQGRDNEAAFDFARAATLEGFGDQKESARVRAMWARFLMRRGAFDDATQVVNEALHIQPDMAFARALQGELALRRGKLEDARTMFEQAFAGSRQVRYLMDEARARALSGDATGAAAVWTQAEKLVRAELESGIGGHRLDLAEILIDRGREDELPEALTLARGEVERRPSADTRFQLARALAVNGDKAGALVQMHALLATGMREAQFYELAARLERDAGAPTRALLYRRLAKQLDPGGSGWRALGVQALGFAR
ncbi:MAG: hypothetical protein H7Z43_08435 [Clostridia bacterium]|nr:hypothetical protein [Deltaproteobacteria bacterium]